MKRNRKRKGSLREHFLSLRHWSRGSVDRAQHLYEKSSAERQSAVGGSGMAGRALAHSVSSGHRHRLGGGIQGYGPEPFNGDKWLATSFPSGPRSWGWF